MVLAAISGCASEAEEVDASEGAMSGSSSSSSSGGEAKGGVLYGTIRDGESGKGLAGLVMQVACPDFTSGEVVSSHPSDVSGGYAVKPQKTGACMARFEDKTRTGTPFRQMVSNPVRVDFGVDRSLNQVR